MNDWRTSDFWRDRGTPAFTEAGVEYPAKPGILWEIIERHPDGTPAMVRQVPEQPGEIDNGHHTVTHWDPDGHVQIGYALTHPSPAFFKARGDAALAAAESLRAGLDQARGILDGLIAQRTAAKTVEAFVALTIAGTDEYGEPTPSVLDRIKGLEELLRQGEATVAELEAVPAREALYIEAHVACEGAMPSLDAMNLYVAEKQG